MKKYSGRAGVIPASSWSDVSSLPVGLLKPSLISQLFR